MHFLLYNYYTADTISGQLVCAIQQHNIETHYPGLRNSGCTPSEVFYCLKCASILRLVFKERFVHYLLYCYYSNMLIVGQWLFVVW